MARPKLKVLKNLITKESVQRLVEKYMSMSRGELLEAAKNPDIPVLDYSICTLLIKSIPTGDFSKLNEFIDDTISKIQFDNSNIPIVSTTTESGEIREEMDFKALKDDLAKSVFVSTKLMVNQTTHEYRRVGQLRETIGKIEEKLFHPETLKKLPEVVLAKVYNSASNNLNNSINYIRSVNGNLTQQLDVISQLEKLQSPIQAEDARVNSPAVARIRELIARKIREKSVNIENDTTTNEAANG